jgi:hypothetical protein
VSEPNGARGGVEGFAAALHSEFVRKRVISWHFRAGGAQGRQSFV